MNWEFNQELRGFGIGGNEMREDTIEVKNSLF